LKRKTRRPRRAEFLTLNLSAIIHTHYGNVNWVGRLPGRRNRSTSFIPERANRLSHGPTSTQNTSWPG
jgi:hypothetical protein